MLVEFAVAYYIWVFGAVSLLIDLPIKIPIYIYIYIGEKIFKKILLYSHSISNQPIFHIAISLSCSRHPYGYNNHVSREMAVHLKQGVFKHFINLN